MQRRGGRSHNRHRYSSVDDVAKDRKRTQQQSRAFLLLLPDRSRRDSEAGGWTTLRRRVHEAVLRAPRGMIFKRTRACKRTYVTTPAAAQDQRYNSRLLTRLFAACRDDSYFIKTKEFVRSRRRVRCSLLSRMASSALSPASPSSSPAAAASSSTSPVQSDAAIPPFMKAISGSLGGMVEAGCLQPIDVIKTRLQLDHNKQYKGIWNCGTTIVQQEGVRALWKGLTPFATHLTLKYTLRMGSNAVLQSALADPQTGEISTLGRLTAGFGAGVLEALAIVTPFEVRASAVSLHPPLLLQSVCRVLGFQSRNPNSIFFFASETLLHRPLCCSCRTRNVQENSGFFPVCLCGNTTTFACSDCCNNNNRW